MTDGVGIFETTLITFNGLVSYISFVLVCTKKPFMVELMQIFTFHEGTTV